MHRRRGHCILLLNLALILVAKYVKSHKYASLNLAQTLFQRLFPPTLALRIFFCYSESKNFPALQKDMECGRFDPQKASPLASDRPNNCWRLTLSMRKVFQYIFPIFLLFQKCLVLATTGGKMLGQLDHWCDALHLILYQVSWSVTQSLSLFILLSE